jgi:alkaline phosphatase D
LWEFESSKLTNVHTHGKMKGSLFSYNDKCSFGELAFDTTMANPRVTYKIFSIDGELVHRHTVQRSELTY